MISGIVQHKSFMVILTAGRPVVVSRTWQVIGSLAGIFEWFSPIALSLPMCEDMLRSRSLGIALAES